MVEKNNKKKETSGNDNPKPEPIISLNEKPNDNKPQSWDDSFENICEELIDESQLNTFLHQKSYRHFTKWSNRFQLPIIILSALSGSANFISPQFGKHKDFILIIIGFVSIIISIISSIAQYLKLAELKEGHRISGFHWEKFYNKIKIQKMIKKENRRTLPDFYDEILIEYQRLKEISPIFLKKISNKAQYKKGYEDIKVPFYLNGFKKVLPYCEKDEILTLNAKDLDISRMSVEV